MRNKEVANYLIRWLQEKVRAAGAQGIVFGNSGGVDSAVAGILAKRAFPSNCLSLILPCETSTVEIQDAQDFAHSFNIPYHTINLDSIYNILCAQLDNHLEGQPTNLELARANLKPRLRMLVMYYMAQNHNYLVVGTTNKSEMAVGYTTKHGDSGVDLQVLGGLIKSEIYELAKYLQVPDRIIAKPPSAGLWEGQTDEEEMGISYTELDDYIKTGKGSPRVIEIIKTLSFKSEHKRVLPPVAEIPETF